MQMADNFSAGPPLPQHLPPAEQNSTSPPPVWWMRLRLESVYRRLEAVQARMALLQRLGGQSVRSRRVYRRLAQEAAALLLAAGLLLTPASGPLHAASITVDGTTCTLNDAITAANTDASSGGCAAGSGADTITLQGNVTLDDTTGALPDITSDITIEGAGFTIERDSGASSSFRIFNVGSGSNLTLNSATISGGAIPTNHGGGIRNYNGTVTLNNSTVSGNSAIYGGGIWALYGTTTLNNSTVSGNSSGYGGGIDSYGSAMTLNNSTVSGNTATSFGGGIRAQVAASSLILNNSTVSGNSANFGGGIWFNNTTQLHKSLIAGNSAPSAGHEVLQVDGTLSANDFNLFGHSGETNGAAFFGFTPSGSDIDATSDGGNPIALASILNTTLADNGGPTMTHALVSGSPAIDAIPSGSRMARSGDGVAASPVLCTPPNTSYDQRGVFRANGTTTGSNCDIGAFEFGATPTAVTIASFTSQTAWGVGPQLAWETGSETGLSGFHIWRGTGDAAETRLTDALIGAAGGLNGHEYTWQDSATFGWGQRTYYWLEAVNGDGSSSFTGPVEVWGIGRLFLPVTGR